MFDVIKVLEKINNEQMSQQEKLKILDSNRVGYIIILYLARRFKNLTIEILGDTSGNILELMNSGELNGYCWQTTETAILFLNDDDYIERGNLFFGDSRKYYHSWICFKFLGEEYVFDPCLDIICKKCIYTETLKADIKGRVTGKEVKEYFINYVTSDDRKEKDNESFNNIFSKIIGEELERTKGEITFPEEEDVNAPMYRNDVGYKPNIKKGKVKKLIAHYYYSE